MDPHPPRKGMVAAVERRCRWSQLPGDLLELVAAHLDLADLVRLGSVCTTWRSAALEYRRRRHRRRGGREPLSMRLPLLLLHRSTPGGTKLGFFSTWRRDFIDLDLPGGSARCCGSSWGWLAMVDDAEFDLFLLNPVTRERIQLPSGYDFPFRPRTAQPYGRGKPVQYVKKVIMSSDPSSGGCVVAAVGRSNTLVLCRPGRENFWWTTFEGEHGGGYFDAVFHGDQLCALDHAGRLTVCALSASLPRVTNFAVVDTSPEAAGHGWHRRLVASAGQLLMVVAWCYHHGVKDASVARALRVFALRMDGWLPVHSLGDRMLFVGEVSSESVAAGDGIEVPGFRADSVCFTRRLVDTAAPHAYGLFCLRTGRILPVSPAGRPLLLEEPAWVTAALSSGGNL